MERQQEVLHVESDEAAALASELAALTGESLASAVTHALRARLEQERRMRDLEAWKARVRAITADIRRNLRHPLPLSTDDSDMYDDEFGLPR